MSTTSTNAFLLLAMSLPAALHAQARPSGLMPKEQFPDASWSIPVHADPEEPSVSWASGPSYKVRFDAGMTFYPVLGTDAPRNLPLRWETESVALGNETLVAHSSEPALRRAGPWRYELVRDAVCEVYEVRADGVEQSFVIAPHARLRRGGDLVIRGQVETPLFARERAAQPAALRFSDTDGRDVLEYGAAFAIDASGRRLALGSALQGDTIELRVPAEWLRDANWPVTVDPLVQRVSLSTSTSGASSYPRVAHDFYWDRMAVCDVRPVSSTDHDIRLTLRQANFASIATIYADLTTANTRLGSVSTCGSTPRRWLLAYEHRTVSTSRVRLHFHDATDQVLNSGLTSEVPAVAGVQDTEPYLAAGSGNLAYVVWKRDVAASPSDTESSRPMGTQVDVDARSFAAPVLLHTNAGTNYDIDAITVSVLGAQRWLVVWQEYNFDNPGDDWDVIVQSVTYGGALGESLVAGEGATNGLHKLTPFVDGYALDWMVCYVTRANTGTKSVSGQGSALRVQRLKVVDGTLKIDGNSKIVESAPGNDLLLGSANRPFAVALETESHWALGWRRTQTNELVVARLGYDCGIAERVVVEAAPASGTYSPLSLCWNWKSLSFCMVYASDSVTGNDPVYGRFFEFDPRAQNIAYGTGCNGTVTASATLLDPRPHAGSKSFVIELSNARPSVPTVLAISGAPADIALGGGCKLLLDPASFAVVYQSLSTIAGKASLSLAIPSAVRGNAFWQFAQLDQGVLTTSNALQTQVY